VLTQRTNEDPNREMMSQSNRRLDGYDPVNHFKTA